MPPLTSSDWSFEANNRLYQSLTQEQRDANLQPLLPLTTNFSLDYPKVCTALSIHIHPLLHTHIAAWQPPPRPVTPLPVSTPASGLVSTLPLPDASTASQPTLLSPVSGRQSTSSPRPAAASVTKGGKKVEAKTAAGKAGKKEELTAVAEKKDEEEKKKEDVPADERDSLSLVHTFVDDGTMAALAMTLAVNRHIRCLRLQYSTMTEAAVRLLPAIVSKSCVQRLYVDRITFTQPIDNSSPHPLLAVLPALAASNVQLLSLSGNALTDADGAAIASALTNNPTLAALTLSNNQLAAATTAALSAALLLNTALAYLNVNYNPLTAPQLLTLLTPFTTAPIEPPPKGANAAKQAAQPPPPYRVQTNKDTKASYREANGSLRQLWCSGCEASGGELVERVRQVVAARRTAVTEGSEGVQSGTGQCSALERLGMECNAWTGSEWAELSAMAPVVSVEAEQSSKHVRPFIAPPPVSTGATDAVIEQVDVAAA